METSENHAFCACICRVFVRIGVKLVSADDDLTPIVWGVELAGSH